MGYKDKESSCSFQNKEYSENALSDLGNYVRITIFDTMGLF